MKKITKLTFYAVGILTFVKSTKYLLNKNKKVKTLNYPPKKEVKKVDISEAKENNNFNVKYIDITDAVLNDLNKQKNKSK